MSFENEFRGMLREVMREVVREEMGARPTDLQNELLTYEQASERFSVSARTLTRWVKAKRLRAFGKGRLRRVRAEDVKACLEEAEQTKAPAAMDVKSKVHSILSSLPGRTGR
ncbi:MAG: helix-turn-helix domain-containing protein [Archangium sp.]|nr:helix-turn-helix domain-containing protein [Archangium sp.]